MRGYAFRWQPSAKPTSKFHISHLLSQLADAVTVLESFDGRGAIIAGDGGAFCAGIDLRHPAVLAPPVGTAINTLMADVTQRLYHCPLVTASLVEAFAIGAGAELATATDFRLLAGPETYIQVRQRASDDESHARPHRLQKPPLSVMRHA